MKQLKPSVNGNDHVFGDLPAPIELVEYGDYECPHCGRAYPIVKDIQRQLGRDLKFVFRNFPLSKIHPYAFSAAVATEAAGLQGKYWEMHDLLFEHQDEWAKSPNPEPDFVALAQRLGLEPNSFMQAMRSPQLQDRVLQDVVRAQDANVEAVPTFFIDGQKQSLPLSITAFVDAIESHLHDKASTNTNR